MRIKEIEARLAAIKQEIEQRGDAMTAAEIDALEQETTQLTEERAGLIAAAEKRNGILDNIAKGAGIVSRSFQQNNGDDNAAPDDPFGTPEYRSAWLKNIRRLPLNDAEKRAFSNASGAGAEVIPTQTANEIISKVKTLAPMLNRDEERDHAGRNADAFRFRKHFHGAYERTAHDHDYGDRQRRK